jgi:hypothetical protein
MKNEAKSGHLANAMIFKRPSWVVLFVSLGAILVGYGVYYGIFPYGQAGQLEAVSTWQMLPEIGSFLLMAAGIFGFATSLIWGFVAAIAGWRGGASAPPNAALPTPN